MVAVSSVTAFASALVHPSAPPDARIRHEAFITHKLAMSAAVLAVAPFFLAFRGAPTPGESLVFAFGLVPLVAAVLVARTGRLDGGHALQVCGLLGLGITLFASASAKVDVGVAIAWLILAQWEAALARAKGLVLFAAAASAVTIILVESGMGTIPVASALLGAVALGYAVAVALVHRATDANGSPPDQRDDRISTLVDALGDVVVGFDAGGSVDHVTGRCETLLGVPCRDLFGRGLFQLVHVADRPAFLKMVADAAHDEANHVETIRIQGRPKPVATGFWEPRFLSIEIRTSRVADADGSRRVMAIVRDVTSAVERETELDTTRRSVEASIRSKDDFLANMSHELRTPLNAIIGFSDMLASQTLRPADPAKQREYAAIINQSGQHLLSVVNSILDMSKIQSGTFAILPEPFDLGPLIAQCCDILRLKAHEGRVRLEWMCSERLEEIVGDRRACKQILLNLISNAVKFTPENGEVVVQAKPEGNAILVIVSDTGVGINADDLVRLGDPFFQARSSFSRPFEGTGLGLSVVRGLIGLHGGSMTIESEPAKGTRVAVRLPLDCQTIADRGTTATIETIARRTSFESTRPSFEPRMKSIA